MMFRGDDAVVFIQRRFVVVCAVSLVLFVMNKGRECSRMYVWVACVME